MKELTTLTPKNSSTSWLFLTQSHEGRSVEIHLVSGRVPYAINIETRKKTVKSYTRIPAMNSRDYTVTKKNIKIFISELQDWLRLTVTSALSEPVELSADITLLPVMIQSNLKIDTTPYPLVDQLGGKQFGRGDGMIFVTPASTAPGMSLTKGADGTWKGISQVTFISGAVGQILEASPAGKWVPGHTVGTGDNQILVTPASAVVGQRMTKSAGGWIPETPTGGYASGAVGQVLMDVGGTITTSDFELGNLNRKARGYAAGGNTTAAVATSVKYDSVTDSWASVAPLPVAKYGSAAFSLNGYGYAAGGYTTAAVATSVKYDSVTDSWASVAPLPVAEYFSAAFSLGNLLRDYTETTEDMWSSYQGLLRNEQDFTINRAGMDAATAGGRSIGFVTPTKPGGRVHMRSAVVEATTTKAAFAVRLAGKNLAAALSVTASLTPQIVRFTENLVYASTTVPGRLTLDITASGGAGSTVDATVYAVDTAY